MAPAAPVPHQLPPPTHIVHLHPTPPLPTYLATLTLPTHHSLDDPGCMLASVKRMTEAVAAWLVAPYTYVPLMARGSTGVGWGGWRGRPKGPGGRGAQSFRQERADGQERADVRARQGPDRQQQDASQCSAGWLAKHRHTILPTGPLPRASHLKHSLWAQCAQLLHVSAPTHPRTHLLRRTGQLLGRRSEHPAPGSGTASGGRGQGQGKRRGMRRAR